jgi:hypothetical protein
MEIIYIGVIFRKIMVHIMGAQMQNAHITDNGFIDQRDFIVQD